MLLAHVVVAVQSLNRVWLFVTLWTAAHQAPLSSTTSQSLLKFMSIDLLVPYNRLILCCPLLLLSIFPSIKLSLFQWVGSSQQVAKVLEFQLQQQSFQWIFRVDFLWDWLLWSPCSPRDSQILLQHHPSCYYDAVIPHSTQSLLTLSFKDQSKFIYPFIGDVILFF